MEKGKKSSIRLPLTLAIIQWAIYGCVEKKNTLLHLAQFTDN